MALKRKRPKKPRRRRSPPKPETPTALYQATVIGFRETVEKLATLDLDVMPFHTHRGDGRWALRVVLTPEQIQPVVGAGATVMLERLIDPKFPSDWLMPREHALAEAEALVKRGSRSSVVRKGRGNV